MKYLRLLLVAPLLVTACVDAQKSENPLSPTLAGPLPGVSITPPAPVEPIDNARIPVGQPITLVLSNAETNGVRPLSYLFEVAVDQGFSNKVFQREGVAPGEGRTELRLPDPLAPERTYYWRAQARDGANSGPYSGLGFFRVYTPIVIDRPRLQAPVNNIETSSVQPEFSIGNAARSGPAGQIGYEIELSDSAAFFNRIAVWTIDEQPGSTRFTPGPLAPGQQYFWRARAFDPAVVGPWSDPQVFRTPRPIVVPPPTIPNGGSCAAAGNEEAVVACRRNQFPGFMSNGQIVAMLRGVAQDLNAAGYPHRPYGILQKTSGTQCNGYSCDIICAGNGGGQRQWDVLIDVQGSQSPTWHEVGVVAVRTCDAP